MKYTRRPLVQGSTGVPIHVQPSMRGNVPKDTATGDIPGFAPSLDLVIETEGMGGLPLTVTLASASLATIVADVHTALDAGGWGSASERDGCLVITTVGIGQDAFIRVVQAVSDFNLDGFPDDAAPILGLPQYPDPLGTVFGGDLLTAATRSRTEANAEGTRFLASGEDRTAVAYNRALAQFGVNDDHLWVLAQTPVAVPTVIELDAADLGPSAAARFNYDVNGNLDQIDLTGLEIKDADWTGRLFVGGGLSNLSTLSEIARYWRISDSSGKELLAWDSTWPEPRRAVRVSSVHRGLRIAVAPVYSDEVSAPAGPLLDTQDTTPVADGRNVLGVNRVKVLSAQIDEVVRGTGVRCLVAAGFGFVPEGAVAGDVAVISGAFVDVPFSHNGTYLVETVTSETELVLRPSSSNNLQALNADAGGSYGTVTVTSGGEWEKEVFITLDPPLPRLPPDGKLRITIGLERPLAVALVDQMSVPTIGSSAEVAAFVSQQLWNRQSLGGAYDGMAKANGGGFFADASSRPATFMSSGPLTPTEGVAGTSYVGNLADSVLVALNPLASFVLEDVGKVVHLTGPVIYAEEEPFIIVEFIDGTHVRVVHGGGRMGAVLADEAGVTYTIYTDSRIDLPGALRALSIPDNAQSTSYGFTFLREQTDAVGVGDVNEGRGYTHLERQRRATTAAATVTNILSTAITAYPGGALLTIGFNPELANNLRTSVDGDTRSVEGYRSPTFVRILNGPSMGWYRLHRTYSTLANRLSLKHLHGGNPVFTNPGFTVYVAFYNLTFGTHVPLTSGVIAGAAVFGNGTHTGDTFSPGLYVDWVGAGAGIYSVLNEPEFTSFDEGNGSEGYHTYVKGFIPAHGAYYDFTAKSSGADSGRGVRTLTAIANSWFLDLSQVADPVGTTGFPLSDPDGWGAWVHQGGKDPALVITRGTGHAGGTPGENPVSLYGIPVANLVVQATMDGFQVTPSSYFGGAADILGSVILRQGDSSAGLSNASNLLVAGSLAVGRTLWSPYPYQLVVQANDEYDPNYKTSFGLPSRAFPATTVDAAIVGADLNAPDYARFPDVPHHAVLSTNDALLADLAPGHLGAAVLLSNSGDPAHDVNYTLAGFIRPLGVTYMALLADIGGVVYADPPDTTDFVVRGRRWVSGYVDTGAWMLVGTDVESDEYKWPWLTIGTSPASVVTAVTAPALGTLGTDTEGALSSLDWSPNSEGKGIGTVWAAASMATVTDTLNNFEAADGYTSNAFSSPWTVDTRQPRSAFPNDGVFSAGTRTAASPGNLVADDFALEHVVLGTGATAEWSSYFGGSIRLVHATGAGTPATVRLWSRGMREMAPDLYGLRARALIWIGSGGVTRNVSLNLRTGNGTSIATTTVSVPGLSSAPGTLEPTEVSALFTAETLLAGAADMLNVNTLSATGLHLTLDVVVTILDNPATPTAGIFVITMGLEPVARPHRVSAMDVAGPLRVGALRTISPVRGFETVGPQQADLLNSAEYAKLHRDDGGNAAGAALGDAEGAQEGRSVGLLQTSAATWYRPIVDTHLLFRKGRNATALVFSQPYYDPFWYLEATWNGASLDYSNRNQCVLPGRAGLIVPVNPPHGSRIVSLHHLASVRPAYYWDGAAMAADFQLWHTLLAKTDTRANWASESVWDALQGYHVRLWRYNCLNFGQEMEDLTNNYSTGNLPSRGFCEPIWSSTVSLADGDAPAFTSNTSFASEHFVTNRQDLYQGSSAATLAKLLVDRRHYSYFVTFEMWGGCRGGLPVYLYAPGIQTARTPTLITSQTGLIPFEGYQTMNPETEGGSAYTWPAMFKFRGLRLGWVTDRPGHGGWG